VPENIRPLRRPENVLAAPGRRWKTNMPGELASPAGRLCCTVLDISSWGAQLRVDQPLPEQQRRVFLVLEAFGTIAACSSCSSRPRSAASIWSASIPPPGRAPPTNRDPSARVVIRSRR
jgi:hypothetical protein